MKLSPSFINLIIFELMWYLSSVGGCLSRLDTTSKILVDMHHGITINREFLKNKIDVPAHWKWEVLKNFVSEVCMSSCSRSVSYLRSENNLWRFDFLCNGRLKLLQMFQFRMTDSFVPVIVGNLYSIVCAIVSVIIVFEKNIYIIVNVSM